LSARLLAVVAGALLAGCAGPLAVGSPSPSPSSSGRPLRYVALGDSYTIGTGVSERERFPNQLVATLAGTVELELVANLGVNGFTSDDLIRRELPALDGMAPEFVTLLIGVNDVVRGIPPGAYRANVQRILDDLLARLPADRIVVVSVPDYTRTPSGGLFGDPAQQRLAIAEVNSIMAEATAGRGIAFVDIGPAADLAEGDPTLVADDGLHPSGAQYTRWVELLAPVVRGLVGDGA
jgi:lysophospholipase L1-like esterase